MVISVNYHDYRPNPGHSSGVSFSYHNHTDILLNEVAATAEERAVAVGNEASSLPLKSAAHVSGLPSPSSSNGSGRLKVSKRRSRAAIKAPLRVLSADRSNFQAVVQQLTGMSDTYDNTISLNTVCPQLQHLNDIPDHFIQQISYPSLGMGDHPHLAPHSLPVFPKQPVQSPFVMNSMLAFDASSRFPHQLGVFPRSPDSYVTPSLNLMDVYYSTCTVGRPNQNPSFEPYLTNANFVQAVPFTLPNEHTSIVPSTISNGHTSTLASLNMHTNYPYVNIAANEL